MKLAPGIAEKYPKLAEIVTHFSNNSKKSVFWDRFISPSLFIVSAEPDVLTYEFKVEEGHCNQLGNLHGGCVATLIDLCSSFSIMVTSSQQWQMMGISTDLSVQYLRGIPEGENIRIECHVHRVGKTLANLFTKIYDQENRLCYTGSHTKFNIDSRL